MSTLTFGSLFAGIGGFDLGFERAGFECRWQVEIDDYATKVLERHWPKVHREKDIRECNASNLERVDCIIGGFPCQDISYAGRGAGLAGERSGLFFEAVRLVRELQPRAVVLENVAALLTRGMDRVLGTLAEVGFDAQWHCIPAAAVGAPHIRDRVFIIAHSLRNTDSNNEHSQQARDQQDSKSSRASGRSDKRKSPDVADSNCERCSKARCSESGCRSCGCGSSLADANSEGLEKRKRKDSSGAWPVCGAKPFRSEFWDIEPDICRVANGIPKRVDRLKCLGNAIVPQVAEVVAKITKDRLSENFSS